MKNTIRRKGDGVRSDRKLAVTKEDEETSHGPRRANSAAGRWQPERGSIAVRVENDLVRFGPRDALPALRRTPGIENDGLGIQAHEPAVHDTIVREKAVRPRGGLDRSDCARRQEEPNSVCRATCFQWSLPK